VRLPYPKLCFALYALALTTVSLLPAEKLSGASFNDKAAHFLCYALFALVAAGLPLAGKRYLLLCIGLILFGLGLEGAQSWVPGRESSLLDALANTAGVAAGAISVYLYSRRTHQSPTM